MKVDVLDEFEQQREHRIQKAIRQRATVPPEIVRMAFLWKSYLQTGVKPHVEP